MKEKRKSGNIQNYMFRTYLLMAAVAVLLEAIIYIYMLFSANSYMRVSHKSELNNLKYEIDKSMANIITQTDSISQNAKARNLLNARNQELYHGEEMERARDMMDTFTDIMGFYHEINSISLIDCNQDTIITQSKIYHGDDYENYREQEMGINEKAFAQLLERNSDPILVLHPGTEACRLYYVKGIYIRSYQNPDGLVLTELSMNYVQEIFTAFQESRDLVYLLSDSTGNYVGKTEEWQKFLSKINIKDKERGEIKLQGKKYVYTSIKSDVCGITYYYVSSYYGFYNIITTTVVFIAINLLILVIISLLLSRRFAMKNARPLRQIMELLKKQEEEDFTYEQMISGVSRLNVRLKGLEDSRKKEYFSLIFTGQEREEANILEFQKQYEAKLSKGFYILGIHIQNLSEHSDHDVLLFCINNIFGELLEDSLIGVPVEMWDKVYFLIQKNGADTGKKITAGMEFLEGRLSMTVCAGISSVKYSFLDIRNAKWEADCMVEYAGLAGINYIPMKYSEIMEQDDLKKGSLQASLKKLINLVLVKDYEKCRELLKELYEGQDVKKYSSIRESRQQMLTFLSFITIPYQEKTGKMNYDSLQDKGMEELYQFSMEILEALTVKEEPDKPGSGIFEEIVSYIQEHIGDPNLSAGEISEKFHITPSYISRIFKRETGEGALDYIHRARIRRGKEMLKEGKTVQEAALSLGYIDARGFIRAFKRYEGITPGQYKGM